ncbi:protein of unknown function [Modestobacter italicus]|uniref:Uncharacterized protein n=1 Tax=Modestobacter italicus (strain DSM 44449 / CECT 9708 / BC 501) TaxID=2732864 RepID=I4EYL0_MODI5|nr:hypothetical protein [Modestobacter marinus]CCH88473.1 protein of unknown function [Modestobacter marinus]
MSHLSSPGLGDVLAARVAGEDGEQIDQCESCDGSPYHAGRAPVTRKSRRSRRTRSRRLVQHPYLDAALGAFGNRWLEVRWHCLAQGVRHSEAEHVANRKALGRAA